MDIMDNITDLVKNCNFMSVANMPPQQQFSFSNFCMSSGQVSVVFSIVVLGGAVVVD